MSFSAGRRTFSYHDQFAPYAYVRHVLRDVFPVSLNVLIVYREDSDRQGDDGITNMCALRGANVSLFEVLDFVDIFIHTFATRIDALTFGCLMGV